MIDAKILDQLAAARAAGLPASTVNGCSCEFCTGEKSFDDNWCARCGDVKLVLPKWWENEDVCDKCETEIKDGNPSP